MTLNELLDNQAVIALISTSLGALITWLFQKSQRDFEYKKFLAQQKYQETEKWKERFIDLSSQLLSELDPFIANQTDNKIVIVKLIHQVQILLNLQIAEHRAINDFIIKLGLEINKETNLYNDQELLSLHGKLSDSIRDVVALKDIH